MKHAFLIISVFCNVLISAHGFGGNTPVHLADKSQVAIEQLCHRIEKSRVHVASSSLRRNTVERKRTRLYGRSTSTSYLRLSFCDICNDGDIVCTPSQPFYVIKSRRWVQACDLQIGDELRSKGGGKAAISRIVFVPEPIDVYAICVQDLHTFFVGKHAILTHNMALSALPFFVKLGCTLGSGGAAGSFLGPFGICFGISTAAMVFLAVHAVCGHGISYSMAPCDLDLLSARFEQDVDGFYTKAPCITVVPVDPSPPCIFVPAPLPEPNRGCGEVCEPVLRAGGCGEIKMPTMDDLVLSYPASVPELPLIHAQEVEISGERAGSKAKPKVEEKKHPHGVHEANAGKHHPNSGGKISKGPTDGQEALDTSVEVKGSDCRVSVNNGEIVVLELTGPAVYHGYVVSWDDIVRASKNDKWQAIQNSLLNNRLVKRNGKIVK